MFIFTKFVALTCVFCVGTAVLMDLGFLLTVRFGGGMGWHRIHSNGVGASCGARLARFISSGMAISSSQS